MPGRDTSTSMQDAVALLPLPNPQDISNHQARGAACVWCTAALATGAVTDLGARRIQVAGMPVSWFPRACHPCTATHAHRALLDHGQSCEQCADNAQECDTVRALYRLVREHRR